MTQKIILIINQTQNIIKSPNDNHRKLDNGIEIMSGQNLYDMILNIPNALDKTLDMLKSITLSK